MEMIRNFQGPNAEDGLIAQTRINHDPELPDE
jgi:hypothetical protein